MSKEEVVCVTGGSGGIGSWVVRLLLDRGYTVHATARNLDDEKETKHLEALQGAETRLRLYQIDLLDYQSIAAAIHGCSGVFHLASPCIVSGVQDPQKELLNPAIKGTLNVLTAAKEKGVRRVVVTSSVAAMRSSDWPPADGNNAEDHWTDPDYCKIHGLWYALSKTLAEKAAWKFAEERGLDVVVVNPGAAIGPVIPPTLNPSMLMLLNILQGRTSQGQPMGAVHFRDVALAHIMVYEDPSATGRHLCVEALYAYSDIAAKVAELYPEYRNLRLLEDSQPQGSGTKIRPKKLMAMGLEFIPLDQIIKDGVESLKKYGFI